MRSSGALTGPATGPRTTPAPPTRDCGLFHSARSPEIISRFRALVAFHGRKDITYPHQEIKPTLFGGHHRTKQQAGWVLFPSQTGAF
jgi:hypothetical protein